MVCGELREGSDGGVLADCDGRDGGGVAGVAGEAGGGGMFEMGERRPSAPRRALVLLWRGVAPAERSVSDGASESSGGGGGGRAGESGAERLPAERLPLKAEAREAQPEASFSPSQPADA